MNIGDFLVVGLDVYQIESVIVYVVHYRYGTTYNDKLMRLTH